MPRRARRPGAAWSSTRRSRRHDEGREESFLPALSHAGPLVDRRSGIEIVAGDDGARRLKAAHSKRRSGPSAVLAAAPLRLLRRLLVSEYFILYLTFAYFLAMAAVLSRPRHAAEHQQPALQRLAAALRRDRADLCHHHQGIDLSQGAIMGFVSVAGAVVMTTGADPNLLGGSPLWGSLLDESRRAPRRAELFGRRGGGGHARRRQPDRPRQRLLHRPLQDAGLHGDAGVADALLVGRHLAHAIAEHRQPAGGVLAARLRRPDLLLFRREGRSRRSSAATSFPSSPIRW